MSDTPGGAPGRPSRPDLEPTINEAGARGFVVDGTDSFAVPGPADGSSVADDGVPAPSVNRSRLLVTMAAVAAGLLFVVAIGRGGSGAAEDAQLRTGQDSGPEYTLPFWNDDEQSADEIVGVPPGPIDDETLRLLEESGQLDDERAIVAEDEFLIEDELDTVTMATFDDSVFDDSDLDDFDDLDDEGIPTYRPLNTTPRRVTTSPRRIPVATTPRVTTPRVVPGDDDEEDEDGSTTTTTQPPSATSTTTSTTTTTTTTTTTLPAAATWANAAGNLPGCPATLRLHAGGDGFVAVADGRLFTTPDPARGWTERTSLTGVRAFAPGPNANAFWVATVEGVFPVTDGQTLGAELGDLEGVRSLAVAPDGSWALAVADGLLHGWNVAEQRWDALSLPVQPALGEVQALDDVHAVLGTNAGVLRFANGAPVAVESPTTAVLGGPVSLGGANWAWLTESGQGVLRSGNGGASWTLDGVGGKVAGDALALAWTADRLLTSGDPDGSSRLISIAGDGSTTDFQPAPPYRPSGLLNVGSTLVAWTTGCSDQTVVRFTPP